MISGDDCKTAKAKKREHVREYHQKPEKPELEANDKFVLDYCKKCWQMTNHIYNKETGLLTCQKCKPKKVV